MALRAHPHSRGENDDARVFGEYNIGSSPLTRGKQGPRPVNQGHAGLIPTHAGKTITRLTPVITYGAHPHSRGENAYRACVGRAFQGSSPLTRGKRAARARLTLIARLIPTHAGKTSLLRTVTHQVWAHPHSRGENLRLVWRFPGLGGSSPLTRGKLACTMHRARCIGLIPTHAGKTDTGRGRSRGCSAHPHSRGENASRP